MDGFAVRHIPSLAFEHVLATARYHLKLRAAVGSLG
jgi:hypothetical protein